MAYKTRRCGPEQHVCTDKKSFIQTARTMANAEVDTFSLFSLPLPFQDAYDVKLSGDSKNNSMSSDEMVLMDYFSRVSIFGLDCSSQSNCKEAFSDEPESDSNFGSASSLETGCCVPSPIISMMRSEIGSSPDSTNMIACFSSPSPSATSSEASKSPVSMNLVPCFTSPSPSMTASEASGYSPDSLIFTADGRPSPSRRSISYRRSSLATKNSPPTVSQLPQTPIALLATITRPSSSSEARDHEQEKVECLLSTPTTARKPPLPRPHPPSSSHILCDSVFVGKLDHLVGAEEIVLSALSFKGIGLCRAATKLISPSHLSGSTPTMCEIYTLPDINNSQEVQKRTKFNVSVDKTELYKTELCVNWMQSRRCSYGTKCVYAHGAQDLKSRLRMDAYKTQPCPCPGMKKSKTSCLYKSRCNYLHPGEAARRQNPGGGSYYDRDYLAMLKQEFPNNQMPFGVYV